jgi:spermidine/putrescine transport system permease protein
MTHQEKEGRTETMEEGTKKLPLWRERLSEQAIPLLVVFPASLMLILFFLAPMFVALHFSLLSNVPFFDITPYYTLENYVRVLIEPIYRNAFIRTGIYAIIATVISLLVSYPVAYYLSRKTKRGGLFLLILLIPFWTSIILRVFSWKIILGSSGILNYYLKWIGLIDTPITFLYTSTGVVFGLVYTYTPYMILPLYATLGKVPNELIEASLDQGANRLQTLVRITFPLTRSGTISAVILVLLASFGDVLSAQLLGGANNLVISTVIFETFMAGSNWTVGSALSVIVFSALLVLAAIFARMGKEAEYA